MDLNTLVLLLVALLNCVTAAISWYSNHVVLQTRKDVAIIEKATNSMKDALVKATGEASRAAGVVEGRQEAENKAANIALGKIGS
jgi:hypothetical protein